MPDLDYKFFNPPILQRDGTLLYGATRCSQCPRRGHLIQKHGWKYPYWEIVPSGPKPGAVGREVYMADLRPYEPTAEELAQQTDREAERERRRMVRAEADLAAQKRSDEWKEYERLRERFKPRQFQPKVRIRTRMKVQPRKFQPAVRKHGKP